MSRRAERRRWRSTGEPAWRRWYARLMRDGLEYCRGCGVEMLHVNLQPRGLRFGHIRAACLGGGDGPGNITIVCGACDEHMGPHDWTGILHGLSTETQWREHQQAILRHLIHRSQPHNRPHSQLRNRPRGRLDRPASLKQPDAGPDQGRAA